MSKQLEFDGLHLCRDRYARSCHYWEPFRKTGSLKLLLIWLGILGSSITFSILSPGWTQTDPLFPPAASTSSTGSSSTSESNEGVQTSSPSTYYRIPRIDVDPTPASNDPTLDSTSDPNSDLNLNPNTDPTASSGNPSGRQFIDPSQTLTAPDPIQPGLAPTTSDSVWQNPASDDSIPTEDPEDPEDPDAGAVFDLDLMQQVGVTSEGSGQGSGSGNVTGAGNNGLNGSGESAAGAGSGFGPGTGSSPGAGTGSGSGIWPGSSSGSPWEPTGEQADPLQAAAQQQGPQTTGLIVDARGLDFQPSMSMRLLDPDGNQVYTTPGVAQDQNAYRVASEGTAAYATSEAQARSLTLRIGERPLVITARKTLGYDLVISTEDAWILRERNQTDQFLDNLAVVVIWDPS